MAREFTQMSFTVSNNRLNSNGGYAISEYGLIYSQNSSYATASTLDLNAVGQTRVGKVSKTTYLAPNALFSITVTGLEAVLDTYYRAYAKNTNGDIAYGLLVNIPPKSEIDQLVPDSPDDTDIGVSGGVYYTYDDDTGTYVYLGITDAPL